MALRPTTQELMEFSHRKCIGLITEGVHFFTGIDYELPYTGKVLTGISKTLRNCGA